MGEQGGPPPAYARAVEIRKATIADSERIARGMKVVVDEERWLATESDATVEGLTEMFRAAIEHDDNVVLVLEQGSELVGSLGLHPTHAKGSTHWGCGCCRSGGDAAAGAC
jgi:hypothetical protein